MLSNRSSRSHVLQDSSSKKIIKTHRKTPVLVSTHFVDTDLLALWIISILERSIFATSDSILSRKVTEKTGTLTLSKRVCHTKNGCHKRLMT